MKTLVAVVMVMLAFIVVPAWSFAGEADAGAAANERTTVKSGKSNSSDRVGTADGKPGAGQGGQGTGQAPPAGGDGVQAPKVKGSKSNTSE